MKTKNAVEKLALKLLSEGKGKEAIALLSFFSECCAFAEPSFSEGTLDDLNFDLIDSEEIFEEESGIDLSELGISSDEFREILGSSLLSFVNFGAGPL